MARGRKRKNGERYSSGGLRPVIDRGTDEIRFRRLSICQDEGLSPDYPLQILLGRNLITQDEHDAGMRFAALYWRIYGQPFKRASGFERVVADFDGRGDTRDAGDDLHANRAYEAQIASLANAGTARAVILALAVYLVNGWFILGILAGKPVMTVGWPKDKPAITNRFQRRLNLARSGLQALQRAQSAGVRVDEDEREEARRQFVTGEPANQVYP